MAPRGRRAGAGAGGGDDDDEAQAFHEFGVRGRKTGVLLKNTGQVDEQGFQPLDSIFSSPTQPASSHHVSRYDDDNDDDDDDDDDDESGSQDMEITSSAGPGPRTILKRQSERGQDFARSSSNPSPTVTKNVRQQAQSNESSSSPMRQDRDVTVTKQLFGRPAAKQRPDGRNMVHSTARQQVTEDEVDEDEIEEEEEDPEPEEEEEEPLEEDLPYMDANMDVGMDESIQMVVNALEEPSDHPLVLPDDQYDEEDEDDIPEPEPQPEPVRKQPTLAAKARGRPKASPIPPEMPETQLQPPTKPPLANKGRVRPRPSFSDSESEQQDDRPPSAEPQQYSPPAKPKGKQVQRPQHLSPPSQRITTSPKRRRQEEPSSEEPDNGQHEPYQVEDSREAKRLKTNQQQKPVPKPTKPTMTTTTTSAKPEPKRRGRPPGRKPKPPPVDDDDDDADASFVELQKGPPLPKRRGLVSVKRDPDTIVQTRAGRQSFRPLHWWAGDKVITEIEERQDVFQPKDAGFVTSTVKGVFRAPEEDPSSKRRGAGRGPGRPKNSDKSNGGRPGRPPRQDYDSVDQEPAHEVIEQQQEEEQELEEWEITPGVIQGDIIAWDPVFEHHPPGDDDEYYVSKKLVAISSEGLQMHDIKDATFRFAKTLTTPFMNAGIVDLPPGTEKRLKNSRKMHMVFFVHYGKVAVTVNEMDFRISAGGQWFVPRGNYYSIVNDYDNPARVFFAQANEVAPAESEEASVVVNDTTIS